MNRTFLFLAFMLLLATKPTAYAQTDSKQQYAAIGNFLLENDLRITDCKIGYRTFGKLNASRTNAVLYPTSGGTTTYMMQLFGAVTEVDTTRFYLILVDALGNGVSSSPSNSASQPKTSFPQFSIRDMVATQYQMLTEKLNIHHLTAIIGGSMGGLQALQWAVSYPDFMDKVIVMEGTPKMSAYDLLWMQTYMEVIKNDPAYQGGNYSVNPPVPLSVHLMQLLLTTPAMLNNTVSADSLSTWLASIEKPNAFSVDCNNMLWQTKATMIHDITAKGSLEKSAKLIKAKMLIIANKRDHVINQALSIKFAGMTKAELITMDNDLGHLIFNEKSVIEAIKKFLAQ